MLVFCICLVISPVDAMFMFVKVDEGCACRWMRMVLVRFERSYTSVYSWDWCRRMYTRVMLGSCSYSLLTRIDSLDRLDRIHLTQQQHH